MRSLYEKLNRLDESLVESKTIVKKKQLTEGYRVDPKTSDFNVGDRVAERYNDSEFNVGTVVEIKKDTDETQYLVEWDYSDREDEEWLYGDVLSLWVEDETEDAYDDDIDEMLTEGNNVSSQLPPAIDEFLQDIAQMYGTITYKDIMEHEYTEEDLKKLENYRRRFRSEIPYEGDKEADQIMKNIAEKVSIIVKYDTLAESQEELTAGRVYTLKEDAFICDNDPNTIKNYLSNPDDASIKHVQQRYLKNQDIIIPRGTKLRYVKEVLIKSFYYDMYSDSKVVFLFSTEFKKHLN